MYCKSCGHYNSGLVTVGFLFRHYRNEFLIEINYYKIKNWIIKDIMEKSYDSIYHEESNG